MADLFKNLAERYPLHRPDGAEALYSAIDLYHAVRDALAIDRAEREKRVELAIDQLKMRLKEAVYD